MTAELSRVSIAWYFRKTELSALNMSLNVHCASPRSSIRISASAVSGKSPAVFPITASVMPKGQLKESEMLSASTA